MGSLEELINSIKVVGEFWRWLEALPIITPLWATLITAAVVLGVVIFIFSTWFYGASFKDVMDVQKEQKELDIGKVSRKAESRKNLKIKREHVFRIYRVQRDALAQGGWISTQYKRLVESLLNTTDRFFGDRREGRDWTHTRNLFDFSGAPAPYWTGHALDRCLSLALIYPLLSVSLVWSATNNDGPIESALFLPDDQTGLMRWGSFLFVSAVPLSIYLAANNSLGGKARLIFVVLSLVMAAGAFTLMPTYTVAIVITVAIAVVGVTALTGMVGIAAAVSLSLIGKGIISIPYLFAVLFWVAISDWKRKLLYVLLISMLFYLLFIVIAPVKLFIVGNGDDGSGATMLLIFFGALPLINALFDWISLGVTRTALRFGMAKGGAWPLLASLADLVVAIICLLGLMVVTLLYLKVFNASADAGGGSVVIDLDGLYQSVTHPGDKPPGVWWIYITIFTTFIPSLINVIIGSLSCLRASGTLQKWLASLMPEDPAALTWSKAPLAAFLIGAQWGLATALGVLFAAAGVQFIVFIFLRVGDPLTQAAAWAMAQTWPEAMVQFIAKPLN